MKHPGLFIGRFQPFHNGHLHALKEVFSKEQQVFVVIGSAQASYTPKNPFTTGERIIMLQLVFEVLNIPCSRYLIVPIPDIHNYQIWVNHVRRYLPPFGIVYTGSETGRKLFSDQKIPVTKISMYNPEVNSGTEIRRRIIENENWKALVPNIIVDFIDEIDGVKRLQSLNY